MVSQKSHSSWWDNHIGLKNSKWISKNIQEMDRCVKDVKKMIEEEGDSFAEKAEMYYKKRPELISHVEDIYRMYRAVAERYVHVTGELSKNVPSSVHQQGTADGSNIGLDSSSPPGSPQQTPDQNISQFKLKARAAGFDFFLASGSSSDSRKEGSASSSSASDSDSDIVQEMEVHPDPDHFVQNRKMIEPDMEELLQHVDQTSPDPFRSVDCEGSQDLLSKVRELDAELAAANEKLQASQEVIEQLRRDLERSSQADAELNLVREQRLKLEDQIVSLEAAVAAYKCEVEQLNAAHVTAVENFSCDISQREQAIQSFEMEIATLRERSDVERSSLEADIADRERSLLELKLAIEDLTQERQLFDIKAADQELAIEKLNATISNSSKAFLEEKTLLETGLSTLSETCSSLQMKIATLEEEKRQLEVTNSELRASSAKQVEELNQNLDTLMLKHDTLSAQKDELSAQATGLIIELENRDALVQQLRAEHAGLVLEAEDTLRRTRKEMDERVKCLEEEWDRQKALLSDDAERQREQLKRDLDALKLNHDMLSSENDDLRAKVSALIVELERRDVHLQQLQAEHRRLISEAEDAQRTLRKELEGRVKHLEEEVERQSAMLSEGAENKREAIRQLCFSLEHYRDGYNQLRRRLLVHRRPPVLLSS